MKNKLLFFGELPSESINGISISNDINLNILRKMFDVSVVEERKQFGIKKPYYLLLNFCKIALFSIEHKFIYFYLSLAVSRCGGIKTLLAILTFKIASSLKLNRSKIILHIHRGDFFDFYSNTFNKVLMRLIFGFADKVVVLSESQVVEFVKNFPKKCFINLPNTINNENIIIKTKDFGSKKFIFLSNYILTKGILDALIVFEKMSSQYDICIECYGDFLDNKLKPNILQFESDRIKINGVLATSAKYGKLAESDCLILPSWSEGQPLVILEAMACGLPVIATDVGLIKEMLGEDYPLYFKVRNTEDLESSLLGFMQYERKKELSEYLINRFDMMFGYGSHKDKLADIFYDRKEGNL